MRKTKTLTALAAVGLLSALGGCEDATVPELADEALLLNAALVAADATIEDFELMSRPFGFDRAGTPGAQNGHGPGRPGGHRGIGGALSGTRSVTFFDENGAEQDAYDPLNTASIHTVMELSGEVSRGSWSASIARERDMTITGLLGEETTRTFNGSGSETVSRSRTLEDGSVQSHDMSGTFTKTDVVVPVPGSDSPYPLSGTIHRTLTVTVVNGPNGDVTRSVEITIVFDGDETATATVNGETFEIDLSARPGSHPIRGGRFGNQGG